MTEDLTELRRLPLGFDLDDHLAPPALADARNRANLQSLSRSAS